MNSTTTRNFVLTFLATFLLFSCSDELRLDQSFVHFSYDYSPEPTLGLLDASSDLDISNTNVKMLQSAERVDFCIDGIKHENGDLIEIQSLTHCPLVNCTEGEPLLTANGQEVKAYLNDNLSIIIHTSQSLNQENWEILEDAVSSYASSTLTGKLSLYTTNTTLSTAEGQAFQSFASRVDNVEIVTAENDSENLNGMLELSTRSQGSETNELGSTLSSLIIVTNDIDTKAIDHQISNYLSTYLLRVVDEQNSILDYTVAEVNRELYTQSYIATNNEGFETSLNAFKESFFSNQRIVFSLTGDQIVEQTTVKINLSK